MASNGTSLRRSCHGCVKVKRRCDLLFPECSRCVKKGVRCQYVNIPLSAQAGSTAENRVVKLAHSKQAHAKPTHATNNSNPNNGNEIIVLRATQSPSPPYENHSLSIPATLEIEIRKPRPPEIIQMVANIVRQTPVLFAQGNSPFIHPCLYGKSMPKPIRDMRDICSLCLSDGHLSGSKLYSLLQQKIIMLLHAARKAANFEELLACVQGLVLAQCIQLTDGNIDAKSMERLNEIIISLSRRLWAQVPTELPSTMTPWRAWMFAESVRRTIIYSHVVSATVSLLNRGYACRTPFVDALPFDVRTWLWEIRSESRWTQFNANTELPMVSLYEFTNFLEFGESECYSSFEGVIVATCRGKQLPIRSVSDILEAV
ncbi:hypothetical protein BGW36DRAFT_389924 [Talaromyces proteolyticus]|uniref:Zn(2)-C6 fungal-type domain-containing protein n=1 Tax=Talaromyces proteolyticus TaxID=1131652 RepID=A0AAD4KGK3_9EURO|nr:uncharacterized protein BGW36DRAFT_389924 [Talaromyces proteolyticus]KAH8689902.1 hypothetical protein BGW36DRAFT_389924 [Talaromyces proteolyticus]